MADQDDSKSAPGAARVVSAEHYRGGVKQGTVQITAYTKHGSTSMLAVAPEQHLSTGDTLKTDAWVLSSRNFQVVGEHKKPMKIPGRWYEVRATAKDS